MLSPKKTICLFLIAFFLVGCTASIKSLPTETSTLLLPTSTPTRMPTPTNTPAPTFTPTSTPDENIAKADYAMLKGDWPAAQELYRSAITGSAEPDRAAFGLARSLEAAGDWAGAKSALENLLAANPRPLFAAKSYILLGDLAANQSDWEGASAAYQQYLASGETTLFAFVQERFGDSLFAAGKYEQAVQAYTALADSSSGMDKARTLEKEADALRAANLPEAAIQAYDAVLLESIGDDARARIQQKAGEILIALDRKTEGYARYQSALQYPSSYHAYVCLAALLDAGYAVDEFLRGEIDYYAGQSDAAILAFTRYLGGSPAEPARAFYFRGLAYRDLQNYDAAVSDLQTAISYGQTSGIWELAIFQAADIQAALVEDYPAAIRTLQRLVEEAPAHPRAAEALYQEAKYAELNGDLATAASLWNQTADRYPASSLSSDARHFAGISQFRLGDYATAEKTFLKLTNSINAEVIARGWFWVAKSRFARGSEVEAKSALESAKSSDPTGYYSIRAGDMLAARSTFSPPASVDYAFLSDKEYQDAQSWVMNMFYTNATPAPQAEALFSRVESDPRFARGKMLWELGWQQEAQKEFDALRVALKVDPASSLALSRAYLQIGYYPGAIFAARQVLDAAGLNDAETFQTPAYFQHIRFGAYFSDLVLANAQEFSLDPMLIYALIRQESLFGSSATSYLSAKGLMQLMPATAQEVAGKLGLTGLTNADLNRPVINVRLGCAYLAEQLRGFDGNIYSALSAYNGGPGNTTHWRVAAPEDDDLFLETIRSEETRNYIRRIAEWYEIYRSLYAK